MLRAALATLWALGRCSLASRRSAQGAEAGSEFPLGRFSLQLALAQSASAPGGGRHVGAGLLPTEVLDGTLGHRCGAALQPLQAVGTKEEDLAELLDTYGLLSLLAKDTFNECECHAILPKAWANGIGLETLDLVESHWRRSVFIARLAEEPDFEVFIDVVGTDTPATGRTLRNVRYLEVINRIQSFKKNATIRGTNIISVLDTYSKPGLDIFLYERELPTLTDFLNGLLEGSTKRPSRGEDEAWRPAIPLRTSIPLIIDLLRGAQDLETAGVIHAHISPDHVTMVGNRRAAIAGLDSTCINSDDPDMGRPSLHDHPGDGFVTSPYWQPPEVESGIPQGFSNHVWATGMILATMCFGENPTKTLVRGDWMTPPPIRMALAGSAGPSGRDNVRKRIAAEFEISDLEDFWRLDEDLRSLLQGMLAKSPSQRWGTAEALERVEAFARARRSSDGLRVPRRRAAPQLPSHWTREEEEETK